MEFSLNFEILNFLSYLIFSFYFILYSLNSIILIYVSLLLLLSSMTISLFFLLSLTFILISIIHLLSILFSLITVFAIMTISLLSIRFLSFYGLFITFIGGFIIGVTLLSIVLLSCMLRHFRNHCDSNFIFIFAAVIFLIFVRSLFLRFYAGIAFIQYWFAINLLKLDLPEHLLQHSSCNPTNQSKLT